MNKRSWTSVIILFLVFDAVVFGVLGWWFLRKPAAASKVFQMLPEQTLALLYIPDAEGSRTRWKETSLHKIWTEPSIQTLLAKPLSLVPDNPNLELARRAAAAPGVRDFFMALTSIEPEPVVLIGLRVIDNNPETDKILTEIEGRLKDLVPAGQSGIETKGSQTYRTYTAAKRKIIAGTFGEWRFWSNNDGAIEQALAVLQRSAAPSGPTLQDSKVFKKVAPLGTSLHDGIAYLNLVPVRDRLVGMVSTMPNSTDAVAAIQKLEAASISIGFNGPQMREVIRIAHAPEKDGRPAGQLSGKGIGLTTEDTVAFYESVIGGGKWLDLEEIEKLAEQSEAFAVARNFTGELRKQGITTESLNSAFGPEVSMQLEWSKGMMQPRGFVRLGVQNREEAAKVMDVLVKGSLGAPWKERETKNPDLTVFSMPLPPALMQPIPALGLSQSSLVLGMNGKDVETFLDRTEAKGKTLEASEAFQEATKQIAPDGSSYVYVDSKGLFTQLYGSIKSALTMMNMFTGSPSGLPVQKLPPTEDIAKHLHPFSMSTKLEGDPRKNEGTVLKIESMGPITFSQSLAGTSVVFAGVAFSQGLLGNLPIPGMENLPIPVPDAGLLPEPSNP